MLTEKCPNATGQSGGMVRDADEGCVTMAAALSS
jgi:hypothetical protein